MSISPVISKVFKHAIGLTIERLARYFVVMSDNQFAFKKQIG